MPYNFAADSFRTKRLCSRLSSRHRAEAGLTIHAFDRQTDAWTDGRTDAHKNTSLAQLQRGKN